jgi:hypothetical protein
MPPEPATEFRFERRETKPFAVSVQAEGLSNPDGETVEDPYSFASVVNAKGRL